MKLSFLEQFEEKFYFKTSHFFWHFLTGLGGLVLVVGILILLWGITPSFKPSASKEEYPKPVKVTVEELKVKIQPPAKKTEASKTTPESTQETQIEVKQVAEVQEYPEEIAYQAAIDSMKVLLPENKYRWVTKGHWERRYYDKRWVIDVWGINDRLKSICKKVNATEFKTKRQLLEAYISLISAFPEEQRFTVLKSAIELSKTDVSTSTTNVALLGSAVQNYSTDNVDFIKTLATFGKKNPRDGRTFIEYSNTIITKFPIEIRRPILTTLVQSYYKYFNLVDKQKRATDLFLEIQNNFESEQQAKALKAYYKLFVNKNYEREQKIEQINSEYEYDLSRAESTLASKKSSKGKYRLLGLEIIGGSVVFIALLALFLVLLSIQRNVKMLKDNSLQTD